MRSVKSLGGNCTVSAASVACFITRWVLDVGRLVMSDFTLVSFTRLAFSILLLENKLSKLSCFLLLFLETS